MAVSNTKTVKEASSAENGVIISVPVSNLEFDPENPRLPNSIIAVDDEGSVIDWMLKDASIIELMGSIGEKGFFPGEPLLVTKDNRKKGKYIVIEGNRRLTASKLLLKPELATKKTISINQVCKEAKFKPSKLPVVVYSKREDILDYLGFKHITGVKPWSALAKAKYVRQLQESYKKYPVVEQYKMLAKAIGSRSDYVRELLIGLDVFDRIKDENYFGIPNLNEDSIDFGVYYNALKYANIAEYIGIDKSNNKPTKNINDEKLEELTRWISEKDSSKKTRLGESRNLQKLNSIVVSERALDVFKEGRSIDDAVMFSDEPYELFKNSILESINTSKLAQNCLSHIQTFSSSDSDNLNDLVATVQQIFFFVENKRSKKTSRKH